MKKEKNPCIGCKHKNELCDLCQYSENGVERWKEIQKNLLKHFA
ncbi:MAG: hypothetical protein PHX08_16060 [Lachnospiraceae bacterium]|nr:hypothetical protein [Lachnospiraceae bacterium]